MVRRVSGKLVKVVVGRSPEVPLIKAREEATELLSKMRKGVNPNLETKALRAASKDTRLLLPVLFEQYLVEGGKDGGLKGSTKVAYTHMFKRLSPLYRLKVDEISASAVNDLHKRINRENGPSAANHSICLLRSIVSFSMRAYSKPDKSPTTAVKWFKETPRREALPPESTAGFLQALVKLKGNNAADLFTLLLFTGMRKSEAMGLLWKDIDLLNGALTIPDTKNGQPLHIPLSGFALDLLKARQARMEGVSKWVFPSNSRCGHVTNSHAHVNELKGLGVSVYPHLLRKTFTTVGSMLCPQVAVDLLTGHIPQDITGKYYTFPSIEELRPHTETITRELLRRAGIAPNPNY